MKDRARWIPLIIAAALAACESPVESGERLVLEPSFQAGTTDGWEVRFADLPATDIDHYELAHGVRQLPAPLDSTRRAIMVSGHNRSDDLFMFLTRQVEGLAPGGEYAVRLEVEFATDAGSQCVGIGGAPGESVYVKAGAVTVKPELVTRDGFVEVNFDKGQQATGGATVPVIGDVANGSSECSGGAYRLKKLTTDGVQPINVTADAQGRIWLVVGTDSGFEGKTTLYYKTIRVRLDRRR